MLSIFDILKLDEGLRYKVYTDTTGHKTVGIGFNMDSPNAKAMWLHADIPESFSAVYNGLQVLSTNSIMKLFNTCVDNARLDLESILPKFDTYPENVQLALTNMMFNLGKPAFSTFNNFLGFIKSNLFANAAADLKHTLWATEVGDRAKRVMALLNNDYSLYNGV